MITRRACPLPSRDRARLVAALAAGAVLAGCAARSPGPRAGAAESGGDPGQVTRALVRVAEVITGAKLGDFPDDRRVPPVEVAESRRPPVRAKSATPPDVSAAPVVAEAAVPPEPAPQAVRTPQPPPAASKAVAAASQQASKAAPAPQPASKAVAATAEPVFRHGRWILVRKSQRTLDLFEDDRRLKTYAVVLGVDPVAAKSYEGDRRTPEGEYHIVAKRAHGEWQRFMLLDYPNADDRQVYAWKRNKGLVPERGGRVAGTGGAIGIHGTADDRLNRGGVNWTWGCISLLSHDIEELYAMVPVGTPVVIQH